MASIEKKQTLLEVSRRVVTTDAEAPVHAVLALFQEEPDLLSVAVMREGTFLGSITRKALFTLASRPFAIDLYAKRPLVTLLEDLGLDTVVMEPWTEINSAAVRLLSLDPTLQTDAFPLVSDGACVGVVAVADLMMAVAEDQRGLLQALDRLSSRIREEVARGTKIQQDLLPLPSCSFKGITIGAGITTSTEIGGDFFDYFTIGESKIGLVVADVSGHGVQAGMVTTAAKASLHTLISLGMTTPATLLGGMNKGILATARQSLLMTCLIATIDVTENVLTVANAGHNFPFLCRGGEPAATILETAAGFPLGFDKDAEYQERTFPFVPGDNLFLYTDGIVECCDSEGEEFGYERLAELLSLHRDLPPPLLHASLLEEAGKFCGSNGFDDDVSTVVAAYRSATETGE